MTSTDTPAAPPQSARDALPRVWLRGNARLAWVTSILACLAALALLAGVAWPALFWSMLMAAALLLLPALWLVVVGGCDFAPRMRYRGGDVLDVHIGRFRRYEQVPLRLIECFLVHAAPSMLPGKLARAPTTSLAIRLDDRAEDFAYRPTNRRFVAWCGSQITIVGTVCEPLSMELVTKLNRYLTLAQRHAAEQHSKGD